MLVLTSRNTWRHVPKDRYAVLTAMRNNKFPNTSRYLQNLQSLQEYGNLTNDHTESLHKATMFTQAAQGTTERCWLDKHREHPLVTHLSGTPNEFRLCGLLSL
jgi:hypothetical protein